MGGKLQWSDFKQLHLRVDGDARSARSPPPVSCWHSQLVARSQVYPPSVLGAAKPGVNDVKVPRATATRKVSVSGAKAAKATATVRVSVNEAKAAKATATVKLVSEAREGKLRADLRIAHAPAEADIAAYQYHQEFREQEFAIWQAFGTTRPVAGLYLDETPQVVVYRRP